MEVFIQMLKKKNEEIRQKKEEDLEFDLIDRRALRVAPVKILFLSENVKHVAHARERSSNSSFFLNEKNPPLK